MSPKAEEQNNEKAIEFGRWLFSQTCTFMIGAADMRDLPKSKQTEVAFAGRSNVGKSSLINALINQKNLARTSKTPGRTQQVNFFNLGPENKWQNKLEEEILKSIESNFLKEMRDLNYL